MTGASTASVDYYSRATITLSGITAAGDNATMAGGTATTVFASVSVPATSTPRTAAPSPPPPSPPPLLSGDAFWAEMSRALAVDVGLDPTSRLRLLHNNTATGGGRVAGGSASVGVILANATVIGLESANAAARLAASIQSQCVSQYSGFARTAASLGIAVVGLLR